MRKTNKIILAVFLVAVLICQVSVVSFGADTVGIRYMYDETTMKCTATAYVDELTSGARLIIAAYDTNGNVVASNLGNTADGAAYLSASITKKNATDTVKAFLWNGTDTSPLIEAGVMGYQFTADDVELFIDGVAFETAIGEALSFEKAEYTAPLKVTSTALEIPKVTYSVNDSTIDVDIATDAENLTTTVNITSGVRIETNKTATNESGKSLTYKEYSKPYSETITIKWVEPNGILTSEKFGNKKAAGNLGLSDIRGSFGYMQKDYQVSYSLAEGASFGKVSLDVSKLARLNSIIIVEPLQKDTKGTDAIVTAEGKALTWVDDTDVIEAYTYTNSGTDRMSEVYDESKVTYAKKSLETPVTLTYATSSGGAKKTADYAVARKTFATDGYFVTGSRVNWTASPVMGGQQFTSVPTAYKGYNTILIDNTTLYDTTFEFYVNQNVKIHVIVNEAVTAKLTGGDAATNTTPYFERCYQNAYDEMSVAYLLENGIIKPGDYIVHEGTTITPEITVNGVKYKYPQNKVTFRKYQQVLKLRTDGYNTGMYILPEHIATSGLTYTENETTVTVENKSVEDYLALFKKCDAKALVTDLSWPEAGLNVYNGTVVTYGSLTLPAISTFNTDTNKSVFGDREGINNALFTGLITQYPDALDIEGEVYIPSLLEFGNGKTHIIAQMYGNTKSLEDYTPYPIYTYKVNRDCEVTVLANGELPAFENNELWTSARLSEAGSQLWSNQNVNDGSRKEFWRIYTRKFSKGDTVTMYTPGYAYTWFINIVKETN